MVSIKFVFTILFLLSGIAVCAQYDPSKIKTEATKLFERSNQLAYNDQFKEALETLKKAVVADPGYEDAYLSMAGIYVELKNYPLALRKFQNCKIDRQHLF